MHRFYLAPEHWNSDALALGGTEAHHARNVLRLQPGAKAVLFNGEGREVTGEVVAIESGAVRFRKLHEAQSAPLSCHITLAQAIPKGKNMDLIVQKAVEIGASEIAPLISDRTVVKLAADDAAAKQIKWQQVAIEAAKQCGQNWLPRVHRPQTMRDFFSSVAAVYDRRPVGVDAHGAPLQHDLRLIGSLQSDAQHLKKILADFQNEHGDRPQITQISTDSFGKSAGIQGAENLRIKTRPNRPRSVLMLIGPEGDFTPAELNLARTQGCLPITLGPIILRVETAAIYCLSVLSYELL